MMPRVALDCAARGLAGIEFGIGVPGTCGASVYGNAGAFGSEIADVLIDCTSLEPSGEPRHARQPTVRIRLPPFAFQTRSQRQRGGECQASRARRRQDGVRERTDAIQAERKASQPYGIRSLGSVFKNPPGDKAGRLIEAAGLKGHRAGGAQISPKHANFIVNVDHATARGRDQHRAVDMTPCSEQFEVDLEREIIVLGRRSQSAIRHQVPERLRIGVFFGSRSVEHEVSVITAQQAMAAMPADRYDPGPRVHREDRGLVHRRRSCSSSIATRTSID